MSLNNLLVPNVYDLYCGSLTTSNDHGSVMTGSQVIATNVPIQIAGNGTSQSIATYAIRGVTQSAFPPVIPSIQYDILENENQTIINVKIPRLTILAASGIGNNPTIIQFVNIAEAIPANATSQVIYVNLTATTYSPGLITATNDGIIELQLFGAGNTYGTVNYGMITDIVFCYTL